MRIRMPPKLCRVFDGPADYRGAYGGRGSGKTRSFATMSAVRGYQWSKAGEAGIIVCGREFMNSLAESSFSEVAAAIAREPFLRAHYDVGDTYIRTKDGRISYDFTGLRHNPDSIKSKANIKLLWVDEAERVSETAWAKAIPSVREEGSEIWVTWNPERDGSATDVRFRKDPPDRSRIVEINFADNPYFPANLDGKRLEDLEKRPESYGHIWLGEYATFVEGAYFARALSKARAEGRIAEVFVNDQLPLRAYCDIGGAGRYADAMAIWIVQFVGEKILVLDYIEGQGQTVGYYARRLRKSGYEAAEIVLPHDGVRADNVTGKRYRDHWTDAGFEARTIDNQGKGAAMMRIEAGRRIFERCVFDAEKCDAGLKALGFYHEKRDEARNVGLGPDHDWSSHGADAFGLMAIDYEAPARGHKGIVIPELGIV